MNMLMESNRCENRYEGSTNVNKNEWQNDNEEVVLESSNVVVVKTNKEPDWQRYVNESTSIPSNIKNLHGICLEVDLTPGKQHGTTETNSMRKETQQKFEVTSPNKVIVMILEDQVQIEQDKEDGEGFSPVIKCRNHNKN